jgi:hypothetical protein
MFVLSTADSHHSSFPMRTIPDFVRSLNTMDTAIRAASHGYRHSYTKRRLPEYVDPVPFLTSFLPFNTQEISCNNASQRSTARARPVLAARTRFGHRRLVSKQQVLERIEQIPRTPACGLYELVEVLGRLGKTSPTYHHQASPRTRRRRATGT